MRRERIIRKGRLTVAAFGVTESTPLESKDYRP